MNDYDNGGNKSRANCRYYHSQAVFIKSVPSALVSVKSYCLPEEGFLKRSLRRMFKGESDAGYKESLGMVGNAVDGVSGHGFKGRR
jgi:hypothetical protein